MMGRRGVYRFRPSPPAKPFVPFDWVVSDSRLIVYNGISTGYSYNIIVLIEIYSVNM